jgi:pimeloyl-ACP methyl ester carboxylesterase
MPKFTSHGAQIYYELRGKGEPIILIAGFGIDHVSWNGPISDTLSKNHQVILFDNRGIGKSDCPDTPYMIEDMAKDVYALMQHLGLPKAIVLGHSMGGAIAMTLAVLHPEVVTKLILCCTFAYVLPAPLASFEVAFFALKNGYPPQAVFPALVPWILSNQLLTNRDVWHYLEKEHSKNLYPQPLIGFKRQFEALKQFDIQKKLSTIQAPAIVIAANLDILAPVYQSEYLTHHLPHSKLKILENVGHAAHLENPKLFAKMILESL